MCYILFGVVTMKKKILPMIVTTMEALSITADQDVPVIYVEDSLYHIHPGQIRQFLGDRGYVLSINRGRKGVFFLKYSGANPFLQDTQEISDPLHIL